MDKEIILHIGSHKTGTTTVQRALFQNADILLKHDVCYPIIPNNYNNHDHGRSLATLFSTRPEKIPGNIRARLTDPTNIKKIKKHYRAALEDYLYNPKIQKVIFSGELLFLLRNEEVKRLYQWLSQFSNNITVVCCTRNPVDWYTSWAQQHLKSRSATIDSYFETMCAPENQQDFKCIKNYDCIKNYIAHFGKDKVVVYDFDKHRENLYQKFLGSCSLEKKLIEELSNKPTVNRNESLSHEATIILDRMNALKPDTTKPKMSAKEAKYLFRIKGGKLELPNKPFKKALMHQQQSITWIAENYPDECGNYLDWQLSLSQNQNKHAVFQEENIDSLALLLSELINENKQLKEQQRMNIKQMIKKKIKQCITDAKITKIYRRLMAKPKENNTTNQQHL